MVEAFDSWSVLAREVVDVLAARLSSNLWNLRFVVASAGSGSVEAMFAVGVRASLLSRWEKLIGKVSSCPCDRLCLP